MNGCGFNDETEGVMVVNTIELVKALGDEASFVAFDTAVRVLFDLKYLFVANNIVV